LVTQRSDTAARDGAAAAALDVVAGATLAEVDEAADDVALVVNAVVLLEALTAGLVEDTCVVVDDVCDVADDAPHAASSEAVNTPKPLTPSPRMATRRVTRATTVLVPRSVMILLLFQVEYSLPRPKVKTCRAADAPFHRSLHTQPVRYSGLGRTSADFSDTLED
jgi:hypothetical protein